MNSKIRQLEIVSTSTCMDFFSKLKDTIVANTNFELLEESTDVDSLSLTFDTKICDFKLKFTTTATSSATSNAIKCFLLHDSRAISTSLNINYSSSNINTTAESTRKINIFIYKNDKFYIVKFGNYNDTSWSISSSYAIFGKLVSKDIAENTERDKILFGTALYDALESTDITYLTKMFNNNPCTSIVMQNLLLANSTSSNATLKEYCTNVFNCTNIASGYRYNINKKTYFAFDPNILVEE